MFCVHVCLCFVRIHGIMCAAGIAISILTHDDKLTGKDYAVSSGLFPPNCHHAEIWQELYQYLPYPLPLRGNELGIYLTVCHLTYRHYLTVCHPDLLAYSGTHVIITYTRWFFRFKFWQNPPCLRRRCGFGHRNALIFVNFFGHLNVLNFGHLNAPE